MFGISSVEFLVIMVIGVIVLGPERLPKVMRMFTKVMSEFRRITTDLQRAVHAEVRFNEHEELKKEAEEELFGTPKPKKKKKKKSAATQASSEPQNQDNSSETAPAMPADGAETSAEQNSATAQSVGAEQNNTEDAANIAAPAKDISKSVGGN